LAQEYRSLLPRVLRGKFADWFSRRQVRRLPYLFSVADKGQRILGLPAGRQPPSPQGFPPTHELLDRSYERMLDRLEAVLSVQPFLLGARLTLADASAYGQLCMNTHDPDAERLIRVRAPATRAWIDRIETADFLPAHACGPERLVLSSQTLALLEEISTTFVALMRQNEAAYEQHAAAGRTLFNEAAFDRGACLYYGSIDGQPFRSVAKSFQVEVWRRVVAQWEDLDNSARSDFPGFAAAISDEATVPRLSHMVG
jgi:hypothetical protein